MKAKNHLSELLRRAEEGEDILIRRGRKGRLFRIVPVRESGRRDLTPNPLWKGKIAYEEEGIWASEWSGEE